MGRSAGREEVQPRDPCRIRSSSRIAIRISRRDSRDRTPENIAVLGIPTSDESVGHGDVEQGKQVGVF